MNRSLLAAALIVATVPALAIAGDSHSISKSNRREVVLQGCVVPGLEKGTAALTEVTELAEPGQSVMPAEAHGRQIVFWLTPDDAIVKHVGEMVQVRGLMRKIEESKVELKNSHRKGVIAKFEGPGKDVKVPNSEVGAAVGTAGREAGGKDVKTFLVRVKVRDVEALPQTCH